MIVVISGSREGIGASVVQAGLHAFCYAQRAQYGPACAIEFRCGDARGVDLFARDWLRRQGYVVDVYCASAVGAYTLHQLNQRLRDLDRPHYRTVLGVSDWTRDGRPAGHIRNERMIVGPPPADLLLTFWNGSSPGTAGAMECARRNAVQVLEGITK